jgi:hypothetical protein
MAGVSVIAIQREGRSPSRHRFRGGAWRNARNRTVATRGPRLDLALSPDCGNGSRRHAAQREELAVGHSFTECQRLIGGDHERTTDPASGETGQGNDQGES